MGLSWQKAEIIWVFFEYLDFEIIDKMLESA